MSFDFPNIMRLVKKNVRQTYFKKALLYQNPKELKLAGKLYQLGPVTMTINMTELIVTVLH